LRIENYGVKVTGAQFPMRRLLFISLQGKWLKKERFYPAGAIYDQTAFESICTFFV
jgi:hypothetical protein